MSSRLVGHQQVGIAPREVGATHTSLPLDALLDMADAVDETQNEDLSVALRQLAVAVPPDWPGSLPAVTSQLAIPPYSVEECHETGEPFFLTEFNLRAIAGTGVSFVGSFNGEASDMEVVYEARSPWTRKWQRVVASEIPAGVLEGLVAASRVRTLSALRPAESFHLQRSGSFSGGNRGAERAAHAEAAAMEDDLNKLIRGYATVHFGSRRGENNEIVTSAFVSSGLPGSTAKGFTAHVFIRCFPPNRTASTGGRRDDAPLWLGHHAASVSLLSEVTKFDISSSIAVRMSTQHAPFAGGSAASCRAYKIVQNITHCANDAQALAELIAALDDRAQQDHLHDVARCAGCIVQRLRTQPQTTSERAALEWSSDEEADNVGAVAAKPEVDAHTPDAKSEQQQETRGASSSPAAAVPAVPTKQPSAVTSKAFAEMVASRRRGGSNPRGSGSKPIAASASTRGGAWSEELAGEAPPVIGAAGFGSTMPSAAPSLSPQRS